MGEKILIGMSGGLDSAWTARLLREEGYSVEGAVLKMHESTDLDGAAECAADLGIPLHVVDCTAAFREFVVDRFVDDYRRARTPNPCVVCNSEVKLRELARAADRLGIQKIATGHYASVLQTEEGRYCIGLPADGAKDQSYMLYRLPQDILARLVLPLSSHVKTDIRREATSLMPKVADKKESQEICFIPEGHYTDFLRKEGVVGREGEFVDEEGRVLGRHKGLVHYTVGQRKGLGVSSTGRLFVKRLEPDTNRVVLSSSAASGNVRIRLEDVVAQAVDAHTELEALEDLTAMLRYRSRRYPARVIRESGSWFLSVDSVMGAVSPGQSAVVYQGDAIAFGGTIAEVK